MLSVFIFILFCVLLISCVLLKISIVYALGTGLVLFIIYGLIKKYSFYDLLKMSLSGIKTVKNILITFLLIGMLTALWRASGCIPAIVCYSSILIKSEIFILISFLLNCLVSFLTGTAFGTATTMGVICMSVATALEINQFWVGGAILSGVYFGDRCSPVSTSALLVATITKTDIYKNIKKMFITSIVPFLITCGIFLIAGFSGKENTQPVDVFSTFSVQFKINLWCLIPAVCILVLAIFRCNVKITMLISIVVSFIIGVFIQKNSPLNLFKFMIWGYRTSVPELQKMIEGGGILSMVRVTLIVCIASCYSGIFRETGFLDFIHKPVKMAGKLMNSYVIYLFSSIISAVIACNQTLSIMLTNQICETIDVNNEERAIILENTAVVIAPLIPWSIAGTVPLDSVGAPAICILGACYLYLLPIWNVVLSLIRKSENNTGVGNEEKNLGNKERSN